VALAHEAIRDLESSNDSAKALKLLERLSFSEDDYLFVYDLHGRCLMHPRQPALVGQDLWGFRDDIGHLVIQKLIATAMASPEGGFAEYRWERPSQRQWRQKLGYVVELPTWGWMLGTGIYLDDVEDTTRQIRASSSAAIGHTMIFIAVIAVLAVMVVAALGVALNVSQQRLADSKLRKLTWQVVSAQEQERARVSRYLHDEALQDLIAVKCVGNNMFQMRLPGTRNNGSSATTIGKSLVALKVTASATSNNDPPVPIAEIMINCAGAAQTTAVDTASHRDGSPTSWASAPMPI
jgi:two-component system NarL family sensor kinase